MVYIFHVKMFYSSDITAAKKQKCQAKPTADAVKKAKGGCITAFVSCKKAQDAAIGLINTCMKGEVKNITSNGRRDF